MAIWCKLMPLSPSDRWWRVVGRWCKLMPLSPADRWWRWVARWCSTVWGAAVAALWVGAVTGAAGWCVWQPQCRTLLTSRCRSTHRRTSASTPLIWSSPTLMRSKLYLLFMKFILCRVITRDERKFSYPHERSAHVDVALRKVELRSREMSACRCSTS